MPSTLDAFIAGVGIVLGCTLFADLWRILARPEPPTAADWACGPDLTVAGVALAVSSLPFTGAEATLLWVLVAALFGVLIYITRVTRLGYYQESYLTGWRLRRSTAIWTSAVGGAALTASWYLSLYEFPLAVYWKELFH
jgi:hypothetical protein